MLCGRRDTVRAFALLEALLAIGNEQPGPPETQFRPLNGATPSAVGHANGSRNGSGTNGRPVRSPERVGV